MAVSVYSEVGRLTRVAVHRPGPEIVRMTQYELEQLLFDDLLAADVAGAEHDLLCDILRAEGAEVLEIEDLLLAALRRAPAEAVDELVTAVCDLAAVRHLAHFPAAWSPDKLESALVHGLFAEELPDAGPSLARLHEQQLNRHAMLLRPVPNLLFMRDPCFTVFDRVMRGRMATDARSREPELVRFALRHGLDEAPAFLFDEDDQHRHPAYRSIEGGDVLVLSPEVVMIGCSERTTPHTIERAAREALFPTFPALRAVYAVMMPKLRSVMHLDTVLTQIDHRVFLGHEPMIAQGEGVSVAVLERGGHARILEGATVLDVLRDVFGSSTAFVPCGGQERLFQRREQWTDGANAVCVGPGRILLYSRNLRTIATLRDAWGYTEVALSNHMDDLERTDRLREAASHERVVYTFTGSELSRARGGARCMTMPLAREQVV